MDWWKKKNLIRLFIIINDSWENNLNFFPSHLIHYYNKPDVVKVSVKIKQVYINNSYSLIHRACFLSQNYNWKRCFKCMTHINVITFSRCFPRFRLQAFLILSLLPPFFLHQSFHPLSIIISIWSHIMSLNCILQ